MMSCGILKSAMAYCMVVANTGSLPASIVPTWIALIELEAKVGIPAHVQKGYPKGTLSSKLGVLLLQVTQLHDELLHRDVFLVPVDVPLGNDSQLIDEDIGVCSDTSNTAGNVAAHTGRQQGRR